MSRLIVLLLTLIAMPAWAGGFKMEIIQFAGDPPGRVREAPGGGRVLVPAMLYTPAGGGNIHGPAIVMLDSGPGAHPLNAGEITRFAAERLAARGYTVLSLYGSQERGYALLPFIDTIWPIKAALDYLESSGYEKFALAAQGYGALVAAQYLKTQPDILLDNGGDKRVNALIMLDPLTDLRKYPRTALATDFDAKVAAAERSVKSGRGLIPTNLEPGQRGSEATDPWFPNGAFIAPAEAFLDYWGPKAATRNAALLAGLTVPVLALIDPHTPSTSRNFHTAGSLEFVDDAKGEAGEGVAADVMAQWLAKEGLETQPQVITTAIDVRTAGGRMLPGVLYTPATGSKPNRPLVMLLHGRAADTVQASTHWMGWRLAQLGYTVIAPGMRISGTAGFAASSMAEVAEDVGHWIDKAGSLGFHRVVLGGHSNGGIWLSNYLSLAHDKRVVGVVFYAPTRDSPAYAAALESPGRYADEVTRMRRAEAEGRGMEVTTGLLTAHTFMDNNAPGARTVHTDRVREYELPALSITGAKDPLMSPDFVAAFARAYKGKLDSIRYDNGSHGLRENKDRAMHDTAAWLDRTFP